MKNAEKIKNADIFKIKNTEIEFFVDSLLAQAFFEDSLIKNAQSSFVSDLINKVKDYFSSKVDPNDQVGSILNLIAPGAISVAFSALGLGKLGSLIGLAMSVFHVDVKGILTSIYDRVKALISSGQKTTSEAIHNAVMSGVQEHSTPATQQEAEEFFKKQSFDQALRDIYLTKFALDKSAGMFDLFSSRKNKTLALLGNILSWIFRIALASAGLVVAGDAINKFFDRPNSFDNTIQNGKPTVPPTVNKNQNKFKVNPSYTNTILNSSSSWTEKIPNNKQAIETMLIDFANEVYDGLSDQTQKIKSSPAFQEIVDKIEWFNHTSPGAPLVFIPKMFTSKKNLVDLFIDDIAKDIK